MIEAANGDKALSYATTEPGSVDLLLADMILTGENGREVAGYPPSPDDPGTFLQKPFGGGEVLRTVRAALDAPRAATAH